MSDLRSDFGDVTAEYRAARNGSGYVSGTSAVIWATGADAVSFLDGQLSQDLPAMEDGSVARTLLLEPKGKLVAIGWVVKGSERVGLAVDASVAVATLERLRSFMFRVDVTLDLDDRATHEIWGSAAVETAGAAGLDPGPGWADHSGHMAAALRGGAIDRVLVLGDDGPLRAAGLTQVGSVAWSTVRIEAGEPVMGIDVDESTIPQESGLVSASVSFTKGCYVGQELVARIDSRGRVNRRLVGLVIGANVVPPVGATVVHEEGRGTITTVGESLTLRAPVAMGLVRREAADGDPVEITWDGGSVRAVVRALPLDDFSDPPHTSRTDDDEPLEGDHEDVTT